MKLEQRGNIPKLVQLLGHGDFSVRSRAAGALSTSGDRVLPAIVAALDSPSVSVRLGAIEFLSTCRLPRVLSYLTGVLEHEKTMEVRLAAVIALGTIDDREAVPVLVHMLRDKNRYIRYASAQALTRLRQVPDSEPDYVYFLIACQDWDTVRSRGSAATGPLMNIFKEDDPETRRAILSVIGELGDQNARQICRMALLGGDARTRWKAVGASMNCGIALHRIPLIEAGHKRTGPDPAAAALLNFLFLGIGYNYLGKWWGFPVFMAYMSIMVLAQLATGPFLPYLVAYPVTAILAVQTYKWADQISDREV
ncbi:MAG: HEAT repeat domain-containing protein [Methanoregula sp.]